LFHPGGLLPKELNPAMLSPYIGVMTDEQDHRYRKWLLAQPHEPFSIADVGELEKSFAVLESK